MGAESLASSSQALSKALRKGWRNSLNAGRKLAGNVLAHVDSRRALRRQGDALAHREPYADHTAFWQAAMARFPSDREIVRKLIHAALKAGKTSVAESALQNLIATRRTRAPDCNFVVGLANAYRRQDADEKLRRLVRRFLESLYGRPDYRLAALRLSRLLFAHFPRHRVDEGGMTSSDVNRNFLRMLARSQAKSGPRVLLSRAAAVEQALAAVSAQTLLDTDIAPVQCHALVGEVRRCLREGRAFSLVRVGDGESHCLAYEPALARHAARDSADRERMWWGSELPPAERTRINALVAEAIWQSNCIGIPTVARFLRDVKLVEDDALENGRTGRGLRAVLHAFANLDRYSAPEARRPIFTSCHIHQDLERWGLYPALFADRPEVLLVSCHADLADYMATAFGVRIAGNILIPPRHASRPLFRNSLTGALPAQMDGIVAQMGDLPKGRLTIVCAGFIGKWFIEAARRKGGVALDLGSIADYWLGINTRSYLDLACKPVAKDAQDGSGMS